MKVLVHPFKTLVSVIKKTNQVRPVERVTTIKILKNENTLSIRHVQTHVAIKTSGLKSVVVIERPTVTVVSICKQGPQGPPGQDKPDLDKMVNPLYQVSRREFINGPEGIVGVDVYSELTGGVLLFERTIDYDPVRGNVLYVQTDDTLNHTRLIKTMIYDDDGELVDIQREMTTWQ